MELAPGCSKSPAALTLIKSHGSGDQEEDAVVFIDRNNCNEVEGVRSQKLPWWFGEVPNK